MNRAFYLFVGAVSWPVTKFAYRLEARGVENIPAEGGLVLAANHTSNFDPWPLAIPLYPQRTLRFMAKIELFNPILKPFLDAGGAFPVRRGEADHEAIETAVRMAREGDIVVMFPEGRGAGKACGRSSSRNRTQAPRGSRLPRRCRWSLRQ